MLNFSEMQMVWWVQHLETLKQQRVPVGQAWFICLNYPCGLNAVTVTLSLVQSSCFYTSSGKDNLWAL